MLFIQSQETPQKFSQLCSENAPDCDSTGEIPIEDPKEVKIGDEDEIYHKEIAAEKVAFDTKLTHFRSKNILKIKNSILGKFG